MRSNPMPKASTNRLRLRLCAGLLTSCIAATPVAAQIYVGTGTNPSGSVMLSNHVSAATPMLLVPAVAIDELEVRRPEPALPIGAGVVRPGALRQPPPSVSALIGAVARDYAVAEALIKAVIAVESGFEPNARSPKGALGLMQLMPETARRFGVRNAYAVEENVRAGTAYLRWLLDLFAGDVSLALAAYNAGEAAVLRAGGRIPDIAETRAYVPKVLAYQAHFSAAPNLRQQ
jgi:soluble lytic murein transglycosylase-like protein